MTQKWINAVFAVLLSSACGLGVLPAHAGNGGGQVAVGSLDCAQAVASPKRLWPTNHRMQDVYIAGLATSDGQPPTITLQCVYQDEPLNGLGDGNTEVDARLSNDGVLLLSKERASKRKGNGNGRVYHVDFTAEDTAAGTSCNGSVKVKVPHRRFGKVKDDGRLYLSLDNGNSCGGSANQPPVINSLPVTTATEFELYQYAVDAVDPEVDALSYQLIDAPQGMLIDSAGLISWLPVLGSSGDYPITIRVSDAGGASVAQSYTLNVQPRENTAPVVTSTPILTATEGQAYSYLLTAVDNEGDAIGFGLVQGPQGLTVTLAGLVQWTPTLGQLGSHAVIVEAIDALGAVSQQSFSIEVAPRPNGAPEILSTPIIEVNENSLYQYTVLASDPEGSTLTYQLVDAPAALGLTDNIITWSTTYDDAGEYPIELVVTDAEGATASQSYLLTVHDVNRAPLFTSVPDLIISENETWQYAPAATDDDGDSVVFALLEGPEGLVLNTSNLAAVLLEWTPDYDAAGNHPVELSVSDGRGGVTVDAFLLTVNNTNRDPHISSTPVETATEGEAYQYQVVADDDDLQPITYSLLASPNGMTISAQGLVTWAPDFTTAGQVAVEIAVSDGEVSVSQAYIIDVEEAGDPPIETAPEVTLPPYDPVATTTMSWPVVANATQYQIEVQTDSGSWQLAALSASTEYNLPTELPTGRYQYRVTACNSSCGIPSVPQGFIYQDETEPAPRDSFALNYSYTYYDPVNKTRLQSQVVHGSRTDLPAGVNDDTTTHYDTMANITSVVNALGHTITMSGHNARGDAGSITDANGVVTELSYHPRGWLLTRTVKDPGGNTANDATTQFDYDNIGQLTKITLPDGSYLEYEYDDARRLTGIENTLGERIEYTLDNAGNRVEEVICAAGTGGDTGTACSIEKTQSRIFDGLSRLRKDIGSSTALPADKTTRSDYDKNSNLETITDGKGEPSYQRFDALNRLVEQIDPDADNSDLSDNPSVSYSYDSRDNITSVTDQEGLITLYQYNVWDDLTQLNSPDTGITDYRYDNAGNRVWMRDARGQVVIYKYDALNRLTTVIAKGSSDELVTYGYDDTSIDNGQVNYGVGRLTHISDQSGRTDYRYDARGNLVKKTITMDGLTFTTKYSYTIADRIESITYPSGRVVSYTRDSDGRITAVNTQADSAAPVNSVISNMAYKPFGPVTGYDFANGISRAITFDSDYLLTDIEDTGGSNPIDWFYRYDANANIRGIDNQTTPTKDQDFTYDKINRLKTADGTYGDIAFTYDDVGNRLTKTHIEGGVTTTETYSYALTSHQLDDVLIEKDDGSANATRGFVYNDNGNTVQDTKPDGTLLDLHYNAMSRYNQLDIDNTPTAWYQHNALGQRVKKAKLIDTVYYHYDESGQLLAESDDSGNIVRDYVFADSMRLARFDNTTPYYFNNDHLGRPIALTDGLGNVALAGGLLAVWASV